VAFSSVNEGRLVSCPAEIRTHEVGPQVLLFLDSEPLGVPPEAFQIVPDLDATIGRLLPRLDEPVLVFTGERKQAREALAAAEEARAETEANYDRRPKDWPRLERVFRNVADQLTAGRDPFVSAAWLGVGRSTRYQRGRRDDTLHAFVEALYWERGNVDAWCELVDLASAAPHVPTLIELVARVPFESRPSVLNQLLTMSYGRDRLGRVSPDKGKHLRDELLALAESQGDTGSVALLASNAGLIAEKAGDLDAAVAWWRRAVAAGSTDEKVADRLSVWLTKRHEYVEAGRVLRQALAVEPQSAEVAERMRRRLTRCERNPAG
jgi:tetratricopeptide (TPR) repeat protein